MRKHTVYALIDGCPLPRGQEYLVWINPCDCSKAYIAELQGQYIGVAPVAQAGTPGRHGGSSTALASANWRFPRKSNASVPSPTSGSKKQMPLPLKTRKRSSDTTRRRMRLSTHGQPSSRPCRHG